jgi:hypothetical protein
MTHGHESDGPSEGAPATPVQPPDRPVPPVPGSGAAAVPLGTPAGADEWRELKRLAELPDDTAAEEPAPEEDPGASPR